MKFHIVVYGCQMNYSDSARIRAILMNCWFSYVENIEEADIVVIDTCSVRQKSEDKVFGKLKQISKDKKIWITGCMIQHNLNLNKLRKFEETTDNMFNIWNFQWNLESREPIIAWLVENNIEEILYNYKKSHPDMWSFKKQVLLLNNAFNPLYKKIKNRFSNLELIFRIDDLGYLPKILQSIGYDINNYDKDIKNEYTWIIPSWSNQQLLEKSKTAYVPIQTGCSQFCAYCIVPYARGLEKNRDMEEVLDEVKLQIQAWAEEIVLVGQIVNKHPQFNQIIKEILKIESLKWLRYTSPYPTYYNDELFSLHEKEEKLCPHIHIPVQSWSDKILKKMFRWYTAKQFKDFIDKIHSLDRNISITSDIIIWFSDETENDFQKSLELAEYSKFDMIYMWVYSPRPGTLWARKYDDNVSSEIKSQRRHQMNEVLKKSSYENNNKDIWRLCDVMITKNDERAVLGYNDQMKNIIIDKPEKDLKVWDFQRIKIYKWDSFNLYWKIT